MKNKPKHIAQADWDAVESLPLSSKMMSRMKPVRETQPDFPTRVRGPQKKPLKVHVSIRLNSDVVAYFKTQGRGWQTKIDDILSEYVKTEGGDVTR